MAAVHYSSGTHFAYEPRLHYTLAGAEKGEEKKMKRVTMLLAAGLVLLAAVALPTFPAVADQEVTDANLDQMIANAKAPADHEAIAAFYDKEAADAEEKARIHHATHKTYESFKIKPIDMAHHCDELAKFYERAAKQAKQLAAAHRAMAKEGGN